MCLFDKLNHMFSIIQGTTLVSSVFMLCKVILYKVRLSLPETLNIFFLFL